jgi:alkanesulfonate monooxygenase SsuD/methylene tetrahydromethanopterin reductase-like flavin-dependent oxidoreductase (luciferase family)
MLRLAGRVADGVALNFVGPSAVPALLATVDEGARAAGRPRPPVTVWTHVTVDPTEETRTAGRRFLATYLRVPGYDRVLAAQGHGDLVAAAARGASTRELTERVPDEMLVGVLGFGDRAAVLARLDDYRSLGVGVAVQAAALGPAATSRATFEALAPAGPPSP